MTETEKLLDYAEQQGYLVHSGDFPESLSCSVDVGGGAIGLDSSLSGQAEKVRLAHEMGHCERGAFYSRHVPTQCRGKLEYMADKWAVLRLVPFEKYCEAFRYGCRNDYELAEYWEVPVDYVPTVHDIYERTRWDDVQQLWRECAENY